MYREASTEAVAMYYPSPEPSDTSSPPRSSKRRLSISDSDSDLPSKKHKATPPSEGVSDHPIWTAGGFEIISSDMTRFKVELGTMFATR